jgi:hypothetical protein
MKKKRETRPRKRQAADVVRLEDLAPRKTVKGGGGRLLFGEPIDSPEEVESPPGRKDIPVSD